jgi:hypothetical protein
MGNCPHIETKMPVRGTDEEDQGSLRSSLKPVIAWLHEKKKEQGMVTKEKA